MIITRFFVFVFVIFSKKKLINFFVFVSYIIYILSVSFHRAYIFLLLIFMPISSIKHTHETKNHPPKLYHWALHARLDLSFGEISVSALHIRTKHDIFSFFSDCQKNNPWRFYLIYRQGIYLFCLQPNKTKKWKDFYRF